MGRILCATRGGEVSIRTQEEAIRLAKERSCELLFLYVVDTSFLDKTAAPVVVDMSGEMERMGDFLLAMAQERAKEQGVEAKILHRRGNIREEIKAAVREGDIDTVVLGHPLGREKDLFDEEELESFASEIERETGVKVVIV